MLNGAKQVHVARKLNLCKTTVRYIWQKYLKTGDVNDAKRGGRPMKTTLRERKVTVQNFKDEPFLTSREVMIEANILGKVYISTMKRYL